MVSSKFTLEYRSRPSSKPLKLVLTSQNDYEVYFYLGSKAPLLYFLNESLIDLSAGDIIVSTPGTLSGEYKRVGEIYSRVFLQLPKYYLPSLISVDPRIERLFGRGARRLRISSCNLPLYYEIIEGIKRGATTKYDPLTAYSKAVSLLSLLCQNLEFENDTVNVTADPLISSIVSVVNEKGSVLNNINDIAKLMNYSPNYLSSYFSDKMHTGLHKFLVAKKLSSATAALLSGKSVTDAALDCGFGSTSYFIQIFKQHYGVTPGKYIETVVN